MSDDQSTSNHQIPEEALSAVVSAMKELEEAKDIPEEMLVELAVSAITQDLLHNQEWIFSELSALKTKILLDPSIIKDQKIPEFVVEEIPTINSQEDLDAVIKKHEIWMDSVINPRKAIASGRAVLRGCNLNGLSLKNANLSCADFSEAQMVGCILQGGNFSKAKFRSSNLQGADLRNAKFKKSDFSEADLRDCDADNADFLHATLNGTVLEGKVIVTPPPEPEITI